MNHSAGSIRGRAMYPLLAFAFGLAAVYHLVALITPSLFPLSPAWRHCLFIILNTTASILFARRWTWLWIPFTVLTIQQLISHGSRAYDLWTLHHHADVISIIIILSMPLIAMFLFIDSRLGVKTKSSLHKNN